MEYEWWLTEYSKSTPYDKLRDPICVTMVTTKYSVLYLWIYNMCDVHSRLVTLLVLASHILTGVHGNHDAKRLYDDLLKKNNYNRLIRPVLHNNDLLEIKLGLKLSQLADVVSPYFTSILNPLLMYSYSIQINTYPFVFPSISPIFPSSDLSVYMYISPIFPSSDLSVYMYISPIFPSSDLSVYMYIYSYIFVQ